MARIDRISGSGTVSLIEDIDDEMLPLSYKRLVVTKELPDVTGTDDTATVDITMYLDEALAPSDTGGLIAYINVREAVADGKMVYIADEHSTIVTDGMAPRQVSEPKPTNQVEEPEAKTADDGDEKPKRKRRSSSGESRSKSALQRARERRERASKIVDDVIATQEPEEEPTPRRRRRERAKRQPVEGFEGVDERGVIVRGDIHLERGIKPLEREEDED